MDYGETILDVFELSYEGSSKPVTIYVDEYSYSDLYAPRGFGCFMPFPVKEP